ncbi:hypothetical protein [Massilia sp. CCM 8734]|uniref:hypothetical protein n=1 Tax=Massilia sp. CCM 8734 TaxID=2609283 RepID=UPI001421276A|nr:hypothetical protein [Massilia sp. CCM 8734]NIA00627.1 hypothetical protein [Massilia sp. CCM 8734]
MLFTVSATFSDFSMGYEQYEADGPAAALIMFLSRAESLSRYEPALRQLACRSDGHDLLHVAGGIRGLWIWHLMTPLEPDDIALYGGTVIQTDADGPLRAAPVA